LKLHSVFLTEAFVGGYARETVYRGELYWRLNVFFTRNKSLQKKW
jgi:hypothetical protein